MKKNILLFLVPLFLLMVAGGHAQDGGLEDNCQKISCCGQQTNFYARILGGFNFLQNTSINHNKSSYNTGYVISGSLGYSWRYGLRLEAEYAYRRNCINHIHFFNQGFSNHGYSQASSYMANLLLDLPISFCKGALRNINPYIGAGIGYDFQRMHSSNSRVIFNQKWNKFAWQLMAGLTYPFFCNTELSLEYKFHQGGCHFYNHSLGLGLIYKFGFCRIDNHSINGK